MSDQVTADNANGAGDDNSNGVVINQAPAGNVDEKPPFKPIESQEAFDAMIKDRIARAQEAERKKFEGYDDLKVKAEKFDASEAERVKREQDALSAEDRVKQESEAAQKAHAELQAAHEAAQKTIAELNVQLLRNEVAGAKGVPAHLVGRLRGDTQEEIEADADDLLAALKPSAGGGLRPDARGGGNPDSGIPSGFDAAGLAQKLKAAGY